MKRETSDRDPRWGDTLSMAQVARRWGLKTKAVKQLLAEQQLAFVQICGSFRIPRAEVERRESSPGKR